jgi:hypothetical protein
LVFWSIHGVAHPGIQATCRMILTCFIWPGMQADVASWCRDCVACQWAKVTKQPWSLVQAIPIPPQRFSHMHVDLVGPLSASNDVTMYRITMIDWITHWLEAVPFRASRPPPAWKFSFLLGLQFWHARDRHVGQRYAVLFGLVSIILQRPQYEAQNDNFLPPTSHWPHRTDSYAAEGRTTD